FTSPGRVVAASHADAAVAPARRAPIDHAEWPPLSHACSATAMATVKAGARNERHARRVARSLTMAKIASAATATPPTGGVLTATIIAPSASHNLIGAPYRCTMRKTVDPLALRAGRSRSLADARSRARLREQRAKVVAEDEAAHDPGNEKAEQEQVALDERRPGMAPRRFGELADDALVDAGPGRAPQHHARTTRKRTRMSRRRRNKNATAPAESTPSNSPSGNCVGTKASATLTNIAPTERAPCSAVASSSDVVAEVAQSLSTPATNAAAARPSPARRASVDTNQPVKAPATPIDSTSPPTVRSPPS